MLCHTAPASIPWALQPGPPGEYGKAMPNKTVSLPLSFLCSTPAARSLALTPQQISEVDSLAVVYEQNVAPVVAERVKLAAELAARLEGHAASNTAANSMGAAMAVGVRLEREEPAVGAVVGAEGGAGIGETLPAYLLALCTSWPTGQYRPDTMVTGGSRKRGAHATAVHGSNS